MARSTAAAVLIVWTVLWLWGCSSGSGYRKTSFIPESISTVYVFSFINLTDRSRLTMELRRGLEQAFIKNGTLAPVQIPADGGVGLEGRIVRLFLQPLTRDATGRIDKARLVLEVQFSLKDLKNGNTLLEDRIQRAVQFVQLQTLPVTDLQQTHDLLVQAVSAKIAFHCLEGRPMDENEMFGHEDKRSDPNSGLLIGKPKNDYDKNNDGVDDRLQGLTNTATNR